jgi:hypothetical protein
MPQKPVPVAQNAFPKHDFHRKSAFFCDNEQKIQSIVTEKQKILLDKKCKIEYHLSNNIKHKW